MREGEGEAIEGSSRRDSLALFFSPWMIHASVREYQCGDFSSVSRRASECFQCNPHIYTYMLYIRDIIVHATPDTSVSRGCE